jgi:hypothetical protein
MKGIKFKEATIELKPSSMTDEECSSLHIYQGDDGTCISCWKADLGQGKVLFHGKIWLVFSLVKHNSSLG